MTEKEIQPIALDGKIIDFKTKEVIEDLDMKKNKKRFTMIDYNKYDNGDCIYYDNGEEMGSLDVLDTLNELNDKNKFLSDFRGFITMEHQKIKEENEQLKSEIRNLRDFREFITEKNVSNEKERKELQLQMLRLYNYFEDYFEDTMSPNSFSEMWDTVKESEKWEKR